ncbi:MAG: SDR family NAD(P)-dependent oxidoreductase [bacterium]
MNMRSTVRTFDRPYVMITGGCGFIGTNLAHRLLKSGKSVLIYDNLSRPDGERNAQWLCDEYGKKVLVKVADVRNRCALREAVQHAGHIFHLAAQVAVTANRQNPVQDFEVDVQGTINLLEELRTVKNPPFLFYTSTNKVYGSLNSINLRKCSTRYEPADPLTKERGINEDYPLSFRTPYGSSKGAAEQYVLDYARTYHLPAVVFRMSCIYGPRQFGHQGWVARFLIQALKKQPITLFGDGRQVRDILFVEDLIEAFLLAMAHMKKLSGKVFNVGGGTQNCLSLLELIDLITEIHQNKPVCLFSRWRVGDPWYYVTDTTRFRKATGWYPKVGVRQGVESLNTWLRQAEDNPSGDLVAMG